MATHKITLHKNGTMSQGKAPCTANYVSRDTARVNDNATKIAEKAGMSPIELLTIITSSIDAIAEREKRGLVRFHLDGMTICGIIPGSLPTADAPLDKKNALQLAVYLDDDVRLCIANEVPEIVTGVGAAKLRVNNLMDLTVKRPMNLVHGQRKFRVAGYNMVMDDEGASAYFEDSKGVVYPAVLDAAISLQLCEFHSESLLEGGDYKFVVKSRAGDAEGPLQSSFRKVKYLQVETPEVKVNEAFGELDGDKVVGELNGENLKMVEGDRLEYEISVGGARMEGDATVTENTSGKIAYEIPGATSEWQGKSLKLTLHSRGGDATYPMQKVEKTFDGA